jgi:hypothetical protein
MSDVWQRPTFMQPLITRQPVDYFRWYNFGPAQTAAGEDNFIRQQLDSSGHLLNKDTTLDIYPFFPPLGVALIHPSYTPDPHSPPNNLQYQWTGNLWLAWDIEPDSSTAASDTLTVLLCDRTGAAISRAKCHVATTQSATSWESHADDVLTAGTPPGWSYDPGPGLLDPINQAYYLACGWGTYPQNDITASLKLLWTPAGWRVQ